MFPEPLMFLKTAMPATNLLRRSEFLYAVVTIGPLWLMRGQGIVDLIQ
jgi:hypothetical protein